MRKFFPALFMLALLSGGLRAATPVHAAPKARAQILRARLSNGLRVVIIRDPLAQVVTTVLNYRVGADEAPAGFPGMAHAQEHMMFRGSPGLSMAQLAEIAQAMGGDYDADTQNNVTQYFFTTPAQDLDVALHVESIRMRGVLDTQALWEKERGAIEQEVSRDHSNPFYKFYIQALTRMFRGTPYAHNALGSRHSFNLTTGAMLRKFHAAWYAPNNAILIITGDVHPHMALAQVKKDFSGISAKKLPQRPAIKLLPVHSAMIQVPSDLPYGIEALALRLPGTASPDFAAAQVLGDVLNSQRGALYGLTAHGQALGTGFFSNHQLPRASVGMVYGVFPKGAPGQPLLHLIRQVLRQYARKGVPADLVAAAKRDELAQAEFHANSIAGLAFLWSDALAVEGRHSPQDNIRAIQKVTVSQVNAVARKYLNLHHAITGILTPTATGKPSTNAQFGGLESFAPKNVKLVTLPPWAARALNRLQIPAWNLQPVTSTLPNGLQLIVVPEKISPTVSVYGQIRSNPQLEEPAGQEGEDSVLNQLFSWGTTSLNRLAYQKALDDIGASESAGESFSLQVLRSHFARGLELLADNELHPALPAPAFQIVQRQTAGEVMGELHSPGFLAQLALNHGLFPAHDPEQRHATPATVMHLTLPVITRYFRKVFRPDLTTLVIIGDISPAQARAAVEKDFGAWKAAGPHPLTDWPPVPANPVATTHVPDPSRVQVSVTMAETLGLNRYNPAYYPLQLGNQVLSGGLFASRLYRDLRENTGLVYYVNSSFQVGRSRAIYSIHYGCDPDKVSQAQAIVVRDLRQMQTAPVTAAELRQAKAQILRDLPLAQASVGAIANGLLSRSLLHLPLNEPEIAARIYFHLSARQVQQAFRKWVRPLGFVEVTQGPAPK